LRTEAPKMKFPKWFLQLCQLHASHYCTKQQRFCCNNIILMKCFSRILPLTDSCTKSLTFQNTAGEWVPKWLVYKEALLDMHDVRKVADFIVRKRVVACGF
jgi:hypothetical protein